MTKLRLLLIGFLLVIVGARAGLINTITVTTVLDEDGSNPSACSLREAVKAVNSRAPYGGCPTGSAFDDNVIQLGAETYQLTLGELDIAGEVKIIGTDSQRAAHDQLVNPLTGKAPRRMRPDFEDSDLAIGKTGTYIVAGNGSRIFNTTAALTLQDLVLSGNGTVNGNGGVIYAGNAVSMDNVVVSGGNVTGLTNAAGNGGAIFLAGDGSALSLTDVTMRSNAAQNDGGALAMQCSLGVNPYASHTINVLRSLFQGNAAGTGAGAISACGNSFLTISASTFSQNQSATNAGAISYAQSSNVGVGQLSLSYVTAAEQVGHVLAVSGLSSIAINGSLLAFNASASDSVCYNPYASAPTPVPMMAAAATGTYNAIGDNSCGGLLAASGNNIDLTSVPFASVLHPITQAAYPSSPDGPPYGLTDYYLPQTGPSSVVDKGDAFATCTAADQRNISRKSGVACDIGAVELLQVTAGDDDTDSQNKTDRLGVVDVLANDTFSEDEVNGPYQFTDNSASSPTVTVTDDGGLNKDLLPRCAWKTSENVDNPGKLVVDNSGVITPTDSPVTCKYTVTDTSGQTSAEATVTVNIKNAAPIAVKDTYLRPVGTTSVTFNPLENDNDDGDGKYGRVDETNPDSAPDWAPYYPIEIVTQPQLGEIVGASAGLCPGSGSSPKTCLNPPLRYVADNNLSPFADSFTYRVYDQDGGASSGVAVTIATDAPDLDHGGGAGSFDLLSGLALSLLGLRRLRKL